MAKSLISGVVLVACLAAGYTGATFAENESTTTDKNDVKIKNSTLSNKVPMGIKCSMTFGGMFSGYYLYPRSSMGAKTPLRLSNSVGIIDAGYRGELGALLDNHDKVKRKAEGMDENAIFNYYTIQKGDRIVQICSPNLTYPIYPILVDSESELGESIRGSGGFGSTGR